MAKDPTSSVDDAASNPADQPAAAGDEMMTADEAAQKPPQKVTIEDLGPARKRLTIEIPQERIAEQLDQSFGRLRTEAAIPGFRRGRVPQRLLEKRFGQSVRDEIRGQLLSEAYHQALEEHELNVLGEPDIQDIDNIELPDQGPMTFSAEVEVSPEIALPSLEGIEVMKKPVTITDEMIDEEVERLRKRFGSYETIPDATIEADDFVQVSVVITGADGTEIINEPTAYINVAGESRDYKCHVVGIVINDLGKQLAGKKPGDDLSVTMVGPESHENEAIRDKPITIQIAITSVERMKPAEVDTLVSQFGQESLDTLRTMIRESIAEREERQQQSAMHEQIVEYLMANTELELPPGITGRQTERVLQREKLELAYQGLGEQEIEEKLAEMRSESEVQARKQLKEYFVVDAVARQLEVDVSESELNGRLAAMAAQQGRRLEKLRQEMQRKGELEYLFMQMREQKTLQAVLEKAKIVDAPADDDAAGDKEKPAAKSSKKKTTKKTPKKKEA